VQRFGSDRFRGKLRVAARAFDSQSPTLELLAPVLALDTGLARRPPAERALLARFVRAKAAATEAGADSLLLRCEGFLAALRRAAAPTTAQS